MNRQPNINRQQNISRRPVITRQLNINRQPNIMTNTALSFILHAVVFTLLAYTVKKQSPMLIPPAYKVSLVSVGDGAGAKASQPPVKKAPELQPPVTKPRVEKPEVQQPVAKKDPPVKKEEKTVPIPKEVPIAKKEPVKPVAEPKKEDKATPEPKPQEPTVNVEDTIAALKAKKKLQQQSKLRSMISLKADSSSNSTQAATQRPGSSPSLYDSPNGVESNDILAQYIGLVGTLIRKQWIFPDSSKKGLEAIVFFSITKDGKVEHVKLDKSSGNTFYDRSCLSAVNKAVPLPVPPVENMEVAIRFYP
ncbi:MAG: TonB family protein [Nitrospirae bacterium]|uniref:cell envelope integrity protein TolA n=1 Tax=Candidatus Magnetobacterium casense TaxID=1455061 RepID=UPI00058C9A7D|nr:TonB family protein [Candidatus Magnetobacterium casensis]MBF0337823.1 TonB family protein [Nitrospirota bacterium]